MIEGWTNVTFNLAHHNSFMDSRFSGSSWNDVVNVVSIVTIIVVRSVVEATNHVSITLRKF